MRTYILPILALLLVGAALSQLAPTSVKVFSYDPATGKHALVFLGGVYYDPVEGVFMIPKPVALPAALPAEQIAAGQGIILTRVPGQPTVVSVDTTAFVMVVPAPLKGGKCKPSTPPSNQLVIASAPGYLFVCVADPATAGEFAWMRIPGQFEF